MNLHNISVLITGASAGIGRALGEELIREGAHVTAFDRKDPKDPPKNWTHHTVDITKSDQIKKAVDKMQKPVDILINNAGIMRRGTLTESAEEDFDALLSVNVKGAWLIFKHVQPLLAPNATIVQMASRHGLSLPMDPALYGLTKRMMMDMGDVIAKTYPEYRVKILCPGPVDTALTHVGATAEEMERKKRIMTTPESIAKKTVQLLKSKTKSRLIFDQQSSTYFLE